MPGEAIPGPVRLTAAARDAVVAHAREEGPFEACGLLGEDGDGRIVAARAVVNAQRSEVSYELDMADQIRIIKEMRSEGVTFAGVYHSHPATEAFPSGTDLEHAHPTGAPYVIVSLARPDDPVVRAFGMDDGQVTERKIEILED